jgi:glycosyltransferase involved in cell wall biosynthesis
MNPGRPSACAPWTAITAYPKWPSPYFAHLDKYAPTDLRLEFRPGLDSLDGTAETGIINLHRLKRLYRDPGTGRGSLKAAEGFLAQLAALKESGWRVAWTVHNLLPIDGPAPGQADLAVSSGVLGLADAVLCHTKADALALRDRTAARTWVTGWSCLDPPTAAPPAADITELAAEIRQWPLSFLMLGHITGYKDVPGTVQEFLASTRAARMAVVGDCPDPRTATRLKRIEAESDGRIRLHLSKVPPDQAGHLYAAADAAVCPYRSDGPFGFFADVLHPSSVGTAAGFGVPVIAPGLPAIAEISSGQRRWLTTVDMEDGLGTALAAAEADLLSCSARHRDSHRHHRGGNPADQWRHIGAVYHQAHRWLTEQNAATAAGETEPARSNASA